MGPLPGERVDVRGQPQRGQPAVELGTLTWIKDGSSLNFHLEELLDWPLAEGVTYRARLLILDDRLVKSFACREELAPAAHGFYCDVADGIFAAPRRWLMTV